MSDFATESGHWYTKSGEAAYTIVGANGNQRNTTVRDARKLGLVPSVTTVCSMEAKPQLTRWLVQQAMLAAITLPRMEGESDDQFMARANSDSQQQTRAAADRGTHLHGQIEQAMRYGLGGMADEDVAIVKPVIDWIEALENPDEDHTARLHRFEISPIQLHGLRLQLVSLACRPSKPLPPAEYLYQ